MATVPNKHSCQCTSCTDGIGMHQFPNDPVVRAKWVKFVQKHQAHFKVKAIKQALKCGALLCFTIACHIN